MQPTPRLRVLSPQSANTEDRRMFRKFILASALVAAAALAPSAGTAGVQAAQINLAGAEDQSLLHQAQFWDIGRCRAWRRECADRWGWRTGQFHRCLARHGCERHRYDD